MDEDEAKLNFADAQGRAEAMERTQRDVYESNQIKNIEI